MEYVKERDYEYIMAKYHDEEAVLASIDPQHRGARIFNRYIRQDRIFDPKSGRSGEEILEEIRRQDETILSLPHPIRKARAFAYVLDNTRISCDSRDLFPAINMVDRPLGKTLVGKWSHEVFHEIIPEIEEKRARLEDDGIVTIWPDYDHSVPVWERLLDLGFVGVLRESEAARASRSNTPEEEAFFEGIKITYEAILHFLERLSKRASLEGSERLSKACATLATEAPKTFYEALLVDYLYFMLCEHIEGLQVRSLSNFDRVFYPFYQSDRERGVEEYELRRELAYFLLQFVSIGNYWGQPVYLGGCNADESTVINELSYLFLDVYDKMGIYNPKIQIKVAKSTPKDFLLKALDMIRRGHNSIVFVNDRQMREALIRAGADPDEARLCDVKGCYEYAIRGAYDSSSMSYLNLLKPLEFALHEGYDAVSKSFSGRKSPKITEYRTFEELFEEYKRQLAHLVKTVMEIANGFEPYLPYVSPQSMLSATIPTAIERARDAMLGGATSNASTMMFGFMADVADSLANIKKYVYCKQTITLPELCEALDQNFEGYDALRLMLKNDRDKYGNNRELPDSIAKEIVDFVCSIVCGAPTCAERDGAWTLGFHVARMSYSQAPYTAASANGRRRGEELSKNLSASMGMNREGATAAILSTTKLDATRFASDAALDLGLLPSAVKGEDGLLAMYGLLSTFCQRNGHALHINVFGADTLRDAQAHPEKYEDLQIRVCGWNVLWNNIGKEEQDGFIRQAEALV